MLNNLKVGVRLGLGFAVLLGLMAALMGVGLTRMADLHHTVVEFAEEDIKLAEYADRIEYLALQETFNAAEVILAPDKSEVPKLLKEIADDRKEMAGQLDKADALLKAKDEKAMLAKVRAAVKTLEASVDRVAT